MYIECSLRSGKYTRVKVRCPKAWVPSGGRAYAHPGDVIEWDNGVDGRFVGRVISRVTNDGSDGLEPFSGLAVIVFGQAFTHAYVNWIDPKHVKRVHAGGTPELMTYIMGPMRPVTEYLAMSASGYLREDYVTKPNAPRYK